LAFHHGIVLSEDTGGFVLKRLIEKLMILDNINLER
jgi:hypothetical protein